MNIFQTHYVMINDYQCKGKLYPNYISLSEN
jgi:hypothetical protein